MRKIKLLCILITLISKSVLSQVGLYKVPLEEQINNSTFIIEGKVLSQKSFWDVERKKIYTLNTIEVFKVFKGEIQVSTIDLITIGGTVGDTTLSVSHNLDLKIEDIGSFILTNSNKSLLNDFNKFPKYKVYAGLQSFYKYDLISNKVSNTFETYNDIKNDFYIDLKKIAREDVTEIKKNQLFKTLTNNENKLVPFISNFSPTTANAGTGQEITISGFSFGNTIGRVQFSDGNDGGATFIDALPSEITDWTDNSITVRVPSRAGTGVIRVLENGSTSFAQSNTQLTVPYAIINRNGILMQHYDTNGTGGYTFQMSSDFNNNIAKDPFIRAFNTWVCATGINWVVSSTTTLSSEFARDGVNVVAFDTPGDELDPGVLGATLNWTTNCGNGVVIDEIDFIFDNERSNWQYGPSSAANNEIDFETVVLHEFGHAHALAHVISPGSLMHWSVSNGNTNRILGTNDLDAGNFVQNISINTPKCSKPLMTSIIDCSLSINEELLNESINLYPNPTKNDFFIENLTKIKIDKVSVYDIRSRLIYTTNVENIKIININLSGISKGVYLVNIYSEKNVVTKKIVLN